MTRISDNSIDLSMIERLIAENKLAEARAILYQAECQTEAREISLYSLLVNVRLHGPECFEARIDALRALTDLTEHEKGVVRRIFLCGFQMAEKAGQGEKQRAYQRLLRRLLLGQALTEPIPMTPKALPQRRIIVLEPSEIVSRPFQGQSEGSIHSPRHTAPGRLALAAGALCLLMMPLSYLGSRVAGAPVHPLAPAPMRDNPVAAAAGAGPQARETKSAMEAATAGTARLTETLQKQLSGLRRAYGRWSAKRGEMGGSIALKLTLDNEGNVIAVNQVSYRFPDADFIKTVMAEARKWQLPMSRSQTSEITVPLLFIPKGAGMGRGQRGSSAKANAGSKNSQPNAPVKSRNEAAGEPETIATKASDAGNPPEPLSLDYVAQQVVPLREEPRFASSTLEQILPGTRMSLIAVQGDWLKVRSARSHSAGFVRKEFVVPDIVGR